MNSSAVRIRQTLEPLPWHWSHWLSRPRITARPRQVMEKIFKRIIACQKVSRRTKKHYFAQHELHLWRVLICFPGENQFHACLV